MHVRKTKKVLYIVFNIFSHHIAHTFLPQSFDFHHFTIYIYPSHYTPLSSLPYAALHFTSLHFTSLHTNLWPTPLLQYFSTFSNKQHDFWKTFIEHNICVSICCTTFVWNIFHSKKNWARYDQNVYCSSC